jgi:thioredoxin 2
MTVVVCANCGAKNRVDERARELQPVCGRCGQKLASDDGGVLTLTEANFADTTAVNVPVLVDCWAAWCGPCRAIAPVVEQLAAESRGRYRVAKLNVDENPRTAAQFQIDSIPTLLIFKNGQVVDRLVGLQPKAAMAERLGKWA